MNPEQVTPTPYYAFQGYNFFKHIFAEDTADVDENFDLLLSYLCNICNRRRDLDGMVIWVSAHFDNNEVLFKDDAEKHQYKYYLFPIRRIDAYLRLHQLTFMIHEHIDEYKLSVKYEPRKPFSDKYDIDEAVRIIIRDESIHNWKRKLKMALNSFKYKCISLVNKVLPMHFRITRYRRNALFDYRYRLQYLNIK